MIGLDLVLPTLLSSDSDPLGARKCGRMKKPRISPIMAMIGTAARMIF